MALEPILQERLAIFADETLTRDEQMRAYYDAGTHYVSPPVDVLRLDIPGPGGTQPARLYRPIGGVQAGTPVLVWFHGGGFVMGDLDGVEADVTAREIAHRGKMAVLSAEYRLCNDGVRFPAPQEDGVAAVQWMSSHRSEYGLGEVFIGGGSAGACLSGSVVQMLRDRGLPQVAGALLIYPVAHAESPPYDDWLRARIESVPAPLLFDPAWMLVHNEMLMGRPIGQATGHDFPGEASDLAGLPRTLIINDEYDSLAVSGEVYGRQLARAGVSVTMFTEPGVVHGHLAWGPHNLVAADHSIDEMVRFIRA